MAPSYFDRLKYQKAETRLDAPPRGYRYSMTGALQAELEATQKYIKGRKFGNGATELMAALERTEADAKRVVEDAARAVDDANRRTVELEHAVKSLGAENDALRANLRQFKLQDYVPGQVVDALVAELNELTASLTNPNAKAKVDAAVQEAVVMVDSEQLREGCAEAFRGADTDRGGSLSILEFGPCARQLFTDTVGWSLPDKTLVYLFQQFDANKDGSLSIDEFHDFFRYLVLVVTKVKSEGFRDAESMPAPEGTLPFVEFEALNATVDALREGTDAKARCMARLEELTAMLHSEDFVSQTIAAFKWADADGSGQLDVYEFCPAARQCILRWLSEDVPDARLHEAFLAFDDNGDRKLSATEFVQFLQYCAVRTVKQSCELILDAKDMTGETGEGSAADSAFQDLVTRRVKAASRVVVVRTQHTGPCFQAYVTNLEQPEAKRRCMEDLERVRSLLQSLDFLEAVVNGFVEADVNLSGRLTLDEFVPVAAAAVSAHFDEIISVSTMCRLFNEFDADCDGTIDVLEYETFVKYLIALVTRRRCEATAESVKWTSSETNLAVARRKELEQKIASCPEEHTRAECSVLLEALDAATSHPDFVVGVASSFLTADFSGDGRLALEEFAPAAVDAIHRFLPKRSAGSAGGGGDGADGVDDGNGSGKVVTPEQVIGLFSAFDMDKDGTLDTSEFVLFVQWMMVCTVSDDVDVILAEEEERRRIRGEEKAAEAREAHVETTEERVQRLQDEAHVAERLVDAIIEEVQQERNAEVEAEEAEEFARARDASIAAEVAAAAAGVAT